MKSRFAPVLVVASALLAGTAHATSTATKQTVTLDRPAIVGESILPAGTYRIDLAAGPHTARFRQGKRIVAESPYTVRLVRVVYPGDAVHYQSVDGGRDRLTKIVFAIPGLAIEFPNELVGGADAPTVKAADRP